MERVESLRTENKFKKTEIGDIPVDWEALNLDNISEEICRYPTYYNIEYQKEGIPEVRGELIWPNGKLEKNLSRYRFISHKTALKFPRTCLKESDFVISVRGTLGKVAIIPKFLDGANITANLIRVSPNRNKIYPLFFHQILISEKFQENINNISSSTTIKTIKAPELKRLKIAIPPLSEQKKIAEILLSVDETIDKKQEIIEKTKMLKKGLMQELFTHGIRHTKFKKTEIGEIPVDWEVKKIKDTGKIITGNTPPTKNLEYYNNDYLWATPGDLGTGKYIEFTARMLSRKGIEVSRLIPRDSILVVCIGSTIGKVGMALHDMATNQQINSIICNKSWNPHFVYYWMLENSDYLDSMAGKHAVPIINKTLFSLFSIPNPSIDEQSTIGLILNSLDEEIENEMAHKERLESIKKGLMQVLLTGKIRVKI